MARVKAEGAPAHPDDVYIHCGCAKCSARFRRQALAYYTFLKDNGMASLMDESDPWFPDSLRAAKA